MSAREEFMKIFMNNIHRDGADKLLAWLESTDFFTAPASSKYHSNHEGGLCEHSVNVFRRFEGLLSGEEHNASMETQAVCGLLHDVCKVNYYKPDTHNVKNADGVWEKVPYYSVDDQLPYGHGEKSVYIISGFMRLTREEAFAIRFHMGDYSDKNTSIVFGKYLIALTLHIADLQATFIDEKEGK